LGIQRKKQGQPYIHTFTKSLGRGEGKPGYLEVSDPEALELAVSETVRPGEMFLREQTRGFQDLLRQNPVSLFMLFGWSSISVPIPNGF
jgi:hypothetical protein